MVFGTGGGGAVFSRQGEVGSCQRGEHEVGDVAVRRVQSSLHPFSFPHREERTWAGKEFRPALLGIQRDTWGIHHTLAQSRDRLATKISDPWSQGEPSRCRGRFSPEDAPSCCGSEDETRGGLRRGLAWRSLTSPPPAARGGCGSQARGRPEAGGDPEAD